MGQKVHPYGFRLGVNKPWRSRWFSERDYDKLLVEDVKLKSELREKLKAAGVSSVEIERPGNKLRFLIRTARPGIVIGRKGAEIEKLKTEFQVGGGGIDVILGDIIWVAEFAANDWLSDLSGRFSAEQRSAFVDGTVRSFTYGGQIYGVPRFLDAGMLFYRKDLLEESGFSEPPKTWEELTAMATKIQAGERAAGNSNLWGFVWQGNAYEGLTCYALEWTYSYGGGTPVGVVSSPEKAALLHDLGVEAVIDRKAANYRFWKDEHTQDEAEWRRLGKDIRALVGDDPDIVFEHPGRQTMGASVFVCKRAGTIVTCAATSGYMIEYDNRHLWMKLKTIKGSHFANYREAWDANQLICDGKVQPPLSVVYPLAEVGEATYQVHHNLHEGKIGVLCLAPEQGLGIDNPERRAAIGEDKITSFRRHGA